MTFYTTAAISAGTTISFTDNEWNGSGFSSGEGTVTWTAPASGVPANSYVELTNLNMSMAQVASCGTATGSSVILSNTNDEIFVYIGAVPTTIGDVCFAGQIGSGTFGGTSPVGAGYVVDLPTGSNAHWYNGTTTSTTDVENTANWQTTVSSINIPSAMACASCGITAFGPATETCQSNTTGDGNDMILVSIPYAGVEDDASVTIDINSGTFISNDGDDPSTVTDGTITFIVSEGDTYDVDITDTDMECSLSTISGVTGLADCDPVCGVTAIGPATTSCVTNTTGDNNDMITVSIPYTGVQSGATVVNNGSGMVGGDDPATVTDGTITVTLTEGESWDIEFDHAICTGLTSSGSTGVADCDPCADPGDIVITEIMQNPSISPESTAEWFEIYNTTGSAIDIQGWTISDDGSDSHVIGSSVVVPAGGYAVLGINATTGTNGGVTVDYEYSGIVLGNGADEIILSCDGTIEVDRVNYDGGSVFPDPSNGISMQLDPSQIDPSANDNGMNWCISTTQFDIGSDFATPGSANLDCFMCAPNATVMVTEIMYDPCSGGSGDTDCAAPTSGSNWWGKEGDGEWVEIYNYGGSTVNLSAYTIGDNSATAVYTIPLGTMLNPGEYLVVAEATIAACMQAAGINAVSGGTLFAARLNNEGDDITIDDCNGTELDIVAGYTNTAPWPPCAEGNDGYSLSLNTAPTGPTDNDSDTDWGVSLNGGDAATLGGGSPGAANTLGVCLTADPTVSNIACNDAACNVTFDLSFSYTDAFTTSYDVYVGGALNSTFATLTSPDGSGSITQTITLDCPTTAGVQTVEVRAAGAVENLCGAYDVDLAVVDCVLPVELIYFDAKRKNNIHHLTWATAQEINNSHFEVQWSTDGIVFNSLGRVEGQGTISSTTHYSFDNRSPKKGINYYRLKQVDYDGQSDLSMIRHLLFNNNSKNYLWSNIVQDEVIFRVDDEAVVDARIYDSTGRLMGVFQVLDGDNIDVGYLSAGVYFFRITDGASVETIKWLKQ